MTFDEDFFIFCRENENEDVSNLIFKLSKHNNNSFKVSDVANQITGLKNTRNKLPSWYSKNIIYPPKLSIEQSSSELTAILKSNLILEGELFIDLTGGMGIDFCLISSKFKESYYIERDKNLCEIASYNFKELNIKNFQVFNEDAVNFIMSLENVADLIYLDPARRNKKGLKVSSITECSPNVAEIIEVLISKSKEIMIKYSPLLDISKAIEELKYVKSVFVMAVKNECKELIFLLNHKEEIENDKIIINCINLKQINIIDKFNFTFYDENIALIEYADKLCKFLYEPNVAIMKGGAFKIIAKEFNLLKLHQNSHLYTSDNLHKDFPGRIFKVIDFTTMNKKSLSQKFFNIKNANVSVRNFPMKASEIQKKLNLKDGGDKYLFATTLFNGEKIIIICEKVIN